MAGGDNTAIRDGRRHGRRRVRARLGCGDTGERSDRAEEQVRLDPVVLARTIRVCSNKW
ncbi:hypothetical protein [Nonomuraea aridisoli]|uniref:hypothetical protein n=1 Tax=Nonomuraea aridisoli TaxID=2070368 RepID=UPI0015E8EAB8|nr:hypothetical protein [Nonomuraea aridisoli]